MAIKQNGKWASLVAVGLLSFSLGGTVMLVDNVATPATVQAASLTSREKLKGYIDKAKLVLANKNTAKIDKEAVQAYYNDAVKAYSSNNAADIKVSNIGLGGYLKNFDAKGNTLSDSEIGSLNIEEGGNYDGNDDTGTDDSDDYDENSVEDNSSSTSDPIADTQDAHKYEESTAQEDNNQGSSNSDSNSETTNEASSHGGSNSTNAASSSTKPNSHSSSAFSEESVNAPGNAGRHVSSSSASSTTPSKANTTKKGNLPGTGEDSRNVVLISVIGILSILGLGGTALALWLRQRKHVNNE